MSDYILIRKSRNILSSVLHVVFNIVLGIGSIAITFYTESWILGIILVLISKWRMFAVRPRFWWLNIKSNLVDLIVGASFIFIAYCSGTTILPVHYALAILYTIWLVIIKPRSSEHAAEFQSLIAIFLGTTAATLMTASAESFFLSAICFIIGYGATRHILVQVSEGGVDFSIITIVAGLIFAEIAWICHGWLIVYTLSGSFFGNTGIIIPQLSIILTVVSFMLGYTYKSISKHDGKLSSQDLVMPAIFTIALLAIIVIWFSKPIFNIF